MPRLLLDVNEVETVAHFRFAANGRIEIAPMIPGGKHPHLVIPRDRIDPAPSHAVFRAMKGITRVSAGQHFHRFNSLASPFGGMGRAPSNLRTSAAIPAQLPNMRDNA